MSAPGMPSGRHETIRAELLVGAEVTRYMRAGVGPAVLLLRRSEEHDPFWLSLWAGLIGQYRVLVPEVGVRDDFAGWLGAFFDGLGITRASLLVDHALSDLAIQFAQQQGDRVTRVIVVEPRDPPEEAIRALIRGLEG